MYCHKCGKQIADGASYCPYCGAALGPALPTAGGAVDSLPAWALVLLHYVTLGIFSIVWVNLYHGKLPKHRPDDPSGGRAVGFLFIPFYNLYWLFFTHMRLCERLNEERKQYGLEEDAPRDLTIAICIMGVIPYINLVWWYLVLYPVLAGLLQASINELVEARAKGLPPAQGQMLPSRCPSCAKETAPGSKYCAYCGKELPVSLAAKSRMEFYGSGWAYVGWGLWAGILLYLVIPATWGYTAWWRWFVRSVRLRDGTEATYTGKAVDRWGSCALLGLLTYASFVPAKILAHVYSNPNLGNLSIVFSFLLLPASVALWWHILRYFIGRVEVTGAGRLAFAGNYAPLLGWSLLCYVSALSIVGWAWAYAAAARWFCSQVNLPEARFEFRGKGHEILWRGIVGCLACSGLISIPWALRWLLQWFVGKVVVVRSAPAVATVVAGAPAGT